MMTERINWQFSFYFFGLKYFHLFELLELKFLFFKGVVGMIWFVFWWFFSYERPAICPSISEEERIYIEESIGESSSLATKVGSFRKY